MSAILKAIRTKCIDCSGGQTSEVRECHITDCPLHLYRMGKNPLSNRKGNPQALRKAAQE